MYSLYSRKEMTHRLFSKIIILFLAAQFMLVLLTSTVSGKDVTKTALIIGNSDYKTTPLKNPVNDARDMADALTKSGFEVFYLGNVNRSQMRRAIREFEESLAKNRGVGLFYFAGHGIQLQGKNYLVPIGADIQKEYEVPDETILADSILEAMDYANNELNIIILDACRNNPFPRSFRSASRGLARMDTMGSGMMIAYATSPGSVALDGDGENGIYTKHLLQAIDTPGLSIEQVFKLVRQKVMKETNRNQTPWEESSLTGDFYFIATDNARININHLSNSSKSSSGSDNQEELMFWQGISNSRNSSDYEAYLQKYPNGVFQELAQSRLKTFASTQPKIKDGMDSSEIQAVHVRTSRMSEKVLGMWKNIYIENKQEYYLKFTLNKGGAGSAEGEEANGSWWASPFQWDIMEQILTLKYKESTEKYKIVSIDDTKLVLVGIEGDAKGDNFSMNSIPENESKKSIKVKEQQLIGTWKDTWDEDGQTSFQIFIFHSDNTVLDTGQTPTEKWSQESKWQLTDNILQILNDENQEYRVVNATPGYLDIIDLSPEYMGEGTRFFRIENKK